MNATVSTFSIVDLAGYSALTEAHGDQGAADAATALYRATRELLGEYGSEELKTLGDAVLLRSDRAGDALSLAARLVCDVGAREGGLGLRAGLDTGPALHRDGEWFGSVLNRAARIVDFAERGAVLLSGATHAAALSEGSPTRFHRLGTRAVKNIPEPLEIYEMCHGNGQSGLAVDPVCRMLLDPERAPESRDGEDGKVYFCSHACASAYDASAQR